MAKKDWDLYGEYTPEPYEFSGEHKTWTVIATVVMFFITAFIVGVGIQKKSETELAVIINIASSVAASVITYQIGKLISRKLYEKNVERERALFAKMKAEAEPYTVCEFCGGRIERKYYDAGKPLMPGPLPTRLGVETFTCDTCRYLVKGHASTQYLASTATVSEYTMVFPEVFETSTVTEEQLNNGRLVNYMRHTKRRVVTFKD